VRGPKAGPAGHPIPCTCPACTYLRDPATGWTVAEPLDARVPRSVAARLGGASIAIPFPTTRPCTRSAVFDRMAVEIARGCTEAAVFCQAGWCIDRCVSAISGGGRRFDEGIRKGGYDETSLASLSPADYSCVSPLVKTAIGRLPRAQGVALGFVTARLRSD